MIPILVRLALKDLLMKTTDQIWPRVGRPRDGTKKLDTQGLEHPVTGIQWIEAPEWGRQESGSPQLIS